jgi:hypothetical protein
VKVLAWDENGFWLHSKRLERGTFGVLEVEGRGTHPRVAVDRAELSMLLEGIDRRSAKFRKHFVRHVRLTARDGRAGNTSR